jgi:hypothetical protein
MNTRDFRPKSGMMFDPIHGGSPITITKVDGVWIGCNSDFDFEATSDEELARKLTSWGYDLNHVGIE